MADIIKFGATRQASTRKPITKTRYQPIPARDGSVLISAERCRELDAEKLCERLSQRFIDAIALMDDDEIALAELLIHGIRDLCLYDDGYYRTQKIVNGVRKKVRQRKDGGDSRGAS